jgi:hypothetical protein
MPPTNIEREGFKEQLRAMVAGRGDGIDLDSADRWVIGGLKDAPAFFRQLTVLIPGDSILYFEGCEIDPEVTRFYEKNRAANAVSVVRDTVFPVPDTHHVAMSPAVIEGVIGLLGRHPTAKCFYHVKAYREEKLLFTFHDAFDGSHLLVSDQVPEENVRAFSTGLGGTCRREKNVNMRGPEHTRRILELFENPQKWRINWPWWKKALYFWKR